jgi:tRNA A37 threonylcarbamoyladenosine synthetase subunit TsaC/SUA5/YrdC
VLLPTETVYGLGADASNPAAVTAIFEAKGRPRFNPLIAHVHDVETAARIAAFDDRALALAAAFWPGPLTIVAPIRDPAAVSASWTWAISGLKRGRPLASKIAATAVGFEASAPRP